MAIKDVKGIDDHAHELLVWIEEVVLFVVGQALVPHAVSAS